MLSALDELSRLAFLFVRVNVLRLKNCLVHLVQHVEHGSTVLAHLLHNFCASHLPVRLAVQSFARDRGECKLVELILVVIVVCEQVEEWFACKVSSEKGLW